MTYGYAQLQPTDRSQWTIRSVRKSLVPALAGAGVGASAIVSVLLVGRALGWIGEVEGEKQHLRARLVGSVALIGIGQLAVAWNEETVFRGYSYSTLRLVAPAYVVAPFLSILFGYYHSYNHWVAWNEVAIGAPLMMLRIASGSIAMPLGYHWAWNFMQSGVFGPSDGAPSLRPIHVHGPSHWIGRPGYPEPGLLSTIVNLLVAAGIGGWLFWRSRRRQGS
jgi:membrane protease YdiL (CAAX protease family)